EVGADVRHGRGECPSTDPGQQDDDVHLASLQASRELEGRGTPGERCLTERGRTHDGGAVPLEHRRQLVRATRFEDDDAHAAEGVPWERHGATLRPDGAPRQEWRTVT